MKIKKILETLMGIQNPPTTLKQIEDLGFEDSYQNIDHHRIYQKGEYRILYDVEHDEILNFYRVEKKK